MREIKFRVWNKIDKEMIYCSSIEVEDSNRGLICCGNVYRADAIMQYTGLKDKNSKEIYEGDILKIPIGDGGYVVVMFEDGMFKAMKYYDFLRDFEPEVVGNIYENPELLKGDKNSKK